MSSTMDMKNSSNSDTTNQNKTDSTKTNNNGFLSAQELAERTIDSLLAEHPGELVRTGSPHIVSATVFIELVKKFTIFFEISGVHNTTESLAIE